MDTLLRLLNARVCLAAAAALGGLFAVARWGGDAVQAYENVRYPPAPPRPVEGTDIDLESDRRELLRLRALHAKVSREIAAARARGADVSGLQEAADQVLALEKTSYRRQAFEQLQGLRMAVPQRAEDFRPAGREEGEDELRTPRPRSGKRVAKPARRREGR